MYSLVIFKSRAVSMEWCPIVKSVQICLYVTVCFFCLLKNINFSTKTWMLLLSALLGRMTIIFLAFSFGENKQTFSIVFMKQIIPVTPGSPLRSVLWIKKLNEATKNPWKLEFVCLLTQAYFLFLHSWWLFILLWFWSVIIKSSLILIFSFSAMSFPLISVFIYRAAPCNLTSLHLIKWSLAVELQDAVSFTSLLI